MYYIYGIVKPWVQGTITDNCDIPRAKPKEEGGYLAIIPRVAMV